MKSQKFTNILLIGLTLLLVIHAVVTIETTKKVERNLQQKIEKLQTQVKIIDGFIKSPQISGIKSVRYQGSWIKVKDYSIVEKKDILAPVRNPPKGWILKKCENSSDLDSCLPFPWPEKYVKEYKHPFNPWAFQRNIAILIKLSKKDPENPTIQNLIDHLVKKSEKFSETLASGARFTSYNFDHNTGPHSVKAGWVSAYGNGRLLQGFSQLYHHFKNLKYKKQADEYFKAFTEIYFAQKKENPKKWFSYVDAAEYLWFEELPLPSKKKSHILNGHIQAMRGLYFYWMATQNKEALKLLKASILTVHRYGNEYRIPGKINRYDLFEDYNPDYSPFRTVSQQKFLYELTGEEFFKILADNFATDMRWHK